MKNQLTPAGIKPATFRFVAQHLNHCATAVPLQYVVCLIIALLNILLTKRLNEWMNKAVLTNNLLKLDC